jgi:hypothetical protein
MGTRKTAMSKVLAASAFGFFGSREVRGLLATAVRLGEAGPMRVVEERVVFIAADRDRHAEHFDAVAGSEFVDDRIRLRE